MVLSRREARTEDILRDSREAQEKLTDLADELDRYVLALQAEVDRLHDHKEPGRE